jgi:hypothetical protein
MGRRASSAGCDRDMPFIDRHAVADDVRPLRLPRLARAMSWFPALINLVPAGVYAVFVLAPWLVYFAGHGTGQCTMDTGCTGPDQLSLLIFPGAGWNPLNWPILAAGAVTLFVVTAGPATPFVFGGLTASGAALGIFKHRPATLAGAVAMLVLGGFQLTPTGGMITAWLLD